MIFHVYYYTHCGITLVACSCAADSTTQPSIAMIPCQTIGIERELALISLNPVGPDPQLHHIIELRFWSKVHTPFSNIRVSAQADYVPIHTANVMSNVNRTICT